VVHGGDIEYLWRSRRWSRVWRLWLPSSCCAAHEDRYLGKLLAIIPHSYHIHDPTFKDTQSSEVCQGNLKLADGLRAGYEVFGVAHRLCQSSILPNVIDLTMLRTLILLARHSVGCCVCFRGIASEDCSSPHLLRQLFSIASPASKAGSKARAPKKVRQS
jgi:hypothetical protein